MTSPNLRRLPAPLEAAVHRLKLAARAAIDRCVESLGLAALSAPNMVRRDELLTAQFELNRKAAIFTLAFNEAFDERVAKECGLVAETTPKPTTWDAMELVDDKQVEKEIHADRFAAQAKQTCEWELRELDGYVSTLLGRAGESTERNPLRPEVLGHALIAAVASVTDREPLREVLRVELTRSLGSDLRATYADVVSRLRAAGVKPATLAVRQRPARPDAGATTGLGDVGADPYAHGVPGRGGRAGGPPYDSRMGGAGDDSRIGGPGYDGRGGRDLGTYASGSGHGSVFGSGSGHGSVFASGGGTGYGAAAGSAAQGARPALPNPHGPRYGTNSGYGNSSGYGSSSGYGAHGASGSARPSIGSVDATMMALMRRLAVNQPGFGSAQGYDTSPQGLLPNVIRAHRGELRMASRGALDHMVIDVIGTLFDQIMSDPKVPPQLARQIARLQVPVLRAALGDASFFASRRHPVRRFINRIASLGAAFEDFSEGEARDFLAKVRDLVQDVVEGEFDQLETYEAKLVALETFAADQARRAVLSHGVATEFLAAKEDELYLQALYAQQLEGDLRGLTVPPFLIEFVTKAWSKVLLRNAARHGADADAVKRARAAARELVMSVQPKTTPQHRKDFLAALPALMQALNEGLNLIGWPDAQRRQFFGQLMPAHAEALKAPNARQLDINLMARQVDGAFAKPMPSRADLQAKGVKLPVLSDEIIVPTLTPDEARKIGFVDEAAVDWKHQVDIDVAVLAAQQEAEQATKPLGPLPAPEGPVEPSIGRELADHVQVGHAYEMNLKGDWHKVRLVHVSPGRTFYVFQRGQRHKQAVSFTHRMLVRLCDASRLRAYEGAQLIERATARVHRHMAGLAPLVQVSGAMH